MLLLMSLVPVHGLGLGEMRVESGLGEPLVAEIELTSATAGELSTLEVTLGNADVFDNAGIVRHSFLTLLEFEIVSSAPPVIRVTTTLPIIEPFLHFIVRVRWDFGMLLSEYTALLDPPLYAQQQPGSVSAPVMIEETDQPVVTSLPEEPASSQPVEPVSAPQSRISGSSAGSFEYGPVAPGDNLWSIASQVSTTGLDANIFQVMIAMLRENPDAFIDNNINRLKSGETLRLEKRESILLVSKADASRSYKAQMEQWESGQPKTVVAAQPEETAPQPEQIGEQTEVSPEAPAAKITTDVVDVDPPSQESTSEGADEIAATESAAQSTEAQQTGDAPQSGKDKYVFKIAPPELEGGSEASEALPDVEVEVEAMRAAIDREIVALREQVSRLELQQRQFESSSDTQAEIESVKAEAEKEIGALREQIAFLKQAAADQEIQALRGQLAAMKRQDTMPGDPAAAPAALAEAQEEIRELRAQVAALSKGQEETAGSAQPDFSDLSNQVQVPQQAAVTGPADAKVEIDAVRAAANAQITSMREQMEAMRTEMAKLLDAQTMREKENTDLEKRVAELVGLLEGKVESTTLATLTTSPAAGNEEAPTGDNDATAGQSKARELASPEGKSGPVWKKWLNELPEDDESRIAIGAGILLILLVLWLMIRRRRSLMRMEESILMTGATLDNPNSQVSEIRSKKPRYLSDLSMAGMGRMEAAEVDPLAEAEVYLAYGRAGQAVQVLKEAAGRNPDRQELKLKLLEIYQQQEDVKSFDDLVSDMDLSEGSADQAAWNKVVELKLKMHDNSPLEAPDTVVESDTSRHADRPPDDNTSEWELTLDDSDKAEAQSNDTLDSVMSEALLDRTAGPVDPALRPFPEPDDNARVGEDVLGSLGRPDQQEGAAETRILLQGQRDQDPDMLNFTTSNHSELNFDLDTGAEESIGPGAGGPGAADSGSPSSAGQNSGDQANEISIKAELAEAYLNMGDKEEALRILEETLVNADPEQKKRITELIRRANQ